MDINNKTLSITAVIAIIMGALVIWVSSNIKASDRVETKNLGVVIGLASLLLGSYVLIR